MMKVSKEDMVALWAAVDRYVHLDHEAERREWERRLAVIEEAVAGIPTLTLERFVPPIANHVPHLLVFWDENSRSHRPRAGYRETRGRQPIDRPGSRQRHGGPRPADLGLPAQAGRRTARCLALVRHPQRSVALTRARRRQIAALSGCRSGRSRVDESIVVRLGFLGRESFAVRRCDDRPLIAFGDAALGQDLDDGRPAALVESRVGVVLRSLDQDGKRRIGSPARRSPKRDLCRMGSVRSCSPRIRCGTG